MENNDKSIHDFDFTFICDYFKALERQGPGSQATTLKAFGFIGGLPANPVMADLGCGTGGQTLTLACAAGGTVTGLDLFPEFIEIFNRNAARAGLADRVKGVVGTMEEPPFGEGELDVIWSEGAIYNVGFHNGLKMWHRYLKPGGYVAVTEASWFTPSRPAEIEKFWFDSYPEIDTIPVKIAQMQDAGYVPVAVFITPETDWTEHFYAPQAPVQEEFLRKYPDNRAAGDLIHNMRREQRLYDKYKEYYGYVFYIGKKV